MYSTLVDINNIVINNNNNNNYLQCEKAASGTTEFCMMRKRITTYSARAPLVVHLYTTRGAVLAVKSQTQKPRVAATPQWEWPILQKFMCVMSFYQPNISDTSHQLTYVTNQIHNSANI